MAGWPRISWCKSINNNLVSPDGRYAGTLRRCNGSLPVSNLEARVLALQSRYGLPVLSTIDFDGAFPEASIHCPANSSSRMLI